MGTDFFIVTFCLILFHLPKFYAKKEENVKDYVMETWTFSLNLFFSAFKHEKSFKEKFFFE